MSAQTIVSVVRRRLAGVPERTTMADEDLRRLVESEVDAALALPEFTGLVDPGAREAMRRDVVNEILGFGPLQDLLDDPTISEIMVNGFDDVWVERDGMIERSPRSFESEDQLLVVIDRMVRSSGRRVDQSSPMVDARLPDGSRLNAILPPLAVDGPAVTVRKFTSSGLSIDDLVASATLSRDAANFLVGAVEARMNILVSGGTGTGKTTVLNVLSTHIGREERVVTIEDAVELALRLPNLVRLEARPGNSEGAGEVNVRDLVRNSLRMRPNRIIVGEVRAGETIDMLQAMNTGHEGSLSTVHANSPRDALRRIETMILLAGLDLPLRAVREQISSAIDLVVHLARDQRGRRFVTMITEVSGMEGEVVSTADLFRRNDAVAGASPELLATGLVSHRLEIRRARIAA
ncbi:MAG: Pilus assembly protein ATPase [Actinomycetota bacterium]|jgi:pilus assembly protein CpaF